MYGAAAGREIGAVGGDIVFHGKALMICLLCLSKVMNGMGLHLPYTHADLLTYSFKKPKITNLLFLIAELVLTRVCCMY